MDACAHGKAFKKADKQEYQRTGRTDRRQRLVPQKAADDKRVRRVIKLLKNLTEQNRQSKARYQLPWAALCHVSRCAFHRNSLQLSIRLFGIHFIITYKQTAWNGEKASCDLFGYNLYSFQFRLIPTQVLGFDLGL